jgi:hypothetical protein
MTRQKINGLVHFYSLTFLSQRKRTKPGVSHSCMLDQEIISVSPDSYSGRFRVVLPPRMMIIETPGQA